MARIYDGLYRYVDDISRYVLIHDCFRYFMYFKRSFVTRSDGLFINYPHINQPEMYPIVYSIAELYIPFTFNQQREIDVLCTLRGHAKMGTRLRVQNWVAEYAGNHTTLSIISGEVSASQ